MKDTRSKHEKVHSIFNICFICCIIVFAGFCCTGCATTNIGRVAVNDGTDAIVANQVAAARLEATVGELDRTINGSQERLETIIRKSERITDSVDRLEYLFSSYESEVNRIISDLSRITREARTEEDRDRETEN